MKTTANSASQPPMTAGQLQAPTILITGATGNIGSELTKILSERGVSFRAMVRSPQDAQVLTALPGADVVTGDFNDPATLAQALAGIERAFLLTPSSEQAEAQQLAFVARAQQAGVRHLIKLSQLSASVDSPVRFLRYHAVVEQAIRASGMNFTFLRPNLFMQGLLGFRASIVGEGNFVAAIGMASISVVDVRDIAAVAATALTDAGHAGKTYTLTGPDALTHRQMADDLSMALGRRITFIDISPEAMRDALVGVGFPIWQADGLIEDYAHYGRNEASAVTSGVQDATGHPSRTFANFARDYAPAFS